MSGVYTTLAKKRAEQSNQAIGNIPVTQPEQEPSQQISSLSQKTTKEENADNIIESKKSESQKVNKTLASENLRKSESQQNDLSENQHFDDQDISTKTSKRFTTYLTKSSLRAIRIIADDEERHDYEVFQEAIDFYLANRKK
jgi:hypothetical protein